jgi:hypothetical protein
VKIQKSKSVTIKAAYIGGMFAIISVLIGVLLSFWLMDIKKPQKLERSKKELFTVAQQIIRNYYGYKKTNIIDARNINLFLNSNDKELCITYSVDDKKYLDVFSPKMNNLEILLHQKFLHDDYNLQSDYVVQDNKAFLIVSWASGNGCFLSVQIYNYDGISKLRLLYEKIAYFGGSSLKVTNNRIIISGNSGIFELLWDSEKFNLIPYKQNLSISTYQGSHVLKFWDKSDFFYVEYDNKIITFNNKNKALKPIIIKTDEIIYIDNSQVSKHFVNVLVMGDKLSFKQGSFFIIKPIKVGKSKIILQDNYKTSYEIGVRINN